MSKGFRKDLTGQRFGMLTVIEFVPNENRRADWKCHCDCGSNCIISSNGLLNDNTRSCGCLRGQQAKKNFTLHGDSKTRLFNIWSMMIRRCTNENNFEYDRYGGRGIKICDEWRKDFTVFRDWALENGYNEKLTIDRIDVNGNYEPNNCRWANAATQNRNKRSNNIVMYNGEKMCLTDAAIKAGLEPKTVFQRYYRGDRGDRLFRPVK